MNLEVCTFEQWCLNAWGQPMRSVEQFLAAETPQIRQAWNFDDASPSLKVHLANKLILESCKQLGSFAESGDVRWFVHSFAREFPAGGITWDLRRIRPVKASLMLVSYSNTSWESDEIGQDLRAITRGGAALAAMYLLGQLEYLLRVKGRYLDEDGKIIRTLPRQLRQKYGITDRWDRVNRIDLAFRFYLYRNPEPLANDLRILNRHVEIAERLRVLRNPVMHGRLPDPAVEASFLALLIAAFHYDSARRESVRETL